MTNEEAIEVLRKIALDVPTGVIDPSDFYLSLALAIKALETGEVYMTGEDYNLYMEGYKAGKKDFEPKHGEWEYVQYDGNENIGNWHCSECGRIVYLLTKTGKKPYYNFCPNCGADMRKGDTDCMDEDAKQASIPYTYNAPQHDWKCGYPDITRGKGGAK